MKVSVGRSLPRDAASLKSKKARIMRALGFKCCASTYFAGLASAATPYVSR